LARSGQPYGASSQLARGASLVRILDAVIPQLRTRWVSGSLTKSRT
jgi:hypothetical protein